MQDIVALRPISAAYSKLVKYVLMTLQRFVTIMMVVVTKRIATRIAVQIIRYASVLLPMFVTALARINSSGAEASTGQVGVTVAKANQTANPGMKKSTAMTMIVDLWVGGKSIIVCAEETTGQTALKIRVVAAMLT